MLTQLGSSGGQLPRWGSPKNSDLPPRVMAPLHLRSGPLELHGGVCGLAQGERCGLS